MTFFYSFMQHFVSFEFQIVFRKWKIALPCLFPRDCSAVPRVKATLGLGPGSLISWFSRTTALTSPHTQSAFHLAFRCWPLRWQEWAKGGC